MSKPGGPNRNSILGALKATEMLDSRPVLPAEILVAILDYLPVSDLMRAARASRRFREMVYDDTRWVTRLKSMGCWDEAEARRRFEDAMRRRREAAEKAKAAQGAAQGKATSTTLFDAVTEEDRRQRAASTTANTVADGFETMSLTAAKDPSQDSGAILDVFKNVRSIRGFARQEYGKIYGAVAPFYYDLIHAKSHVDPIVFKAFRDPERQAQMLSNLRKFTKSDWAQGWAQREEKLMTMVGIFESAVLREFEQGYEFWDIDGRMKRYATVLHFLNGATAGVHLFIDKHPVFNEVQVSSNPADCLDGSTSDGLTLEPARAFLEGLAKKVNEQAGVIGRIFPEPEPVFWTFVDKVREDIIMEYCTPLFDEAHERNTLAYLKAVSGMSEHCMRFFQSLEPPNNAQGGLEAKTRELALKIFEPHLDLYFQEELDYFTAWAESEVADWEKKLSEQDASVESFYMSNFNRQADKKDFLSSFKKVVMMPVTVLPTIGSPFATSKPAQSTTASGSSGTPSGTLTPTVSRSSTMNPLDGRRSPLPEKAPDDELAAKTALMTSRLEGIKGLFSLEVALDLVHAAKSSLGRTAVFMNLGGHSGEEAKEQCATMFVVLLRILGSRHIKTGFDKAVDHLALYNPRAVSEHSDTGVAPLVTFIELVNVGDLISQMIDVFYEQQLAATKIADKNDFLDPAGLAKKKFEQMLDESVAAGLNKGIDVLMDEVEFLHGSTQLPTDYNPGTTAAGGERSLSASDLDVGPTPTARRVVELVSSHTKMLVGTTEKSMLDVFNGEVGLRLFNAVCKHLKRQRVSTDGAIKLISDANLYFDYARTLRNQDLLAYFGALRELSQIFLIDAAHAKDMAVVIADGDRFGGVFRAEEVLGFAQRRADWYQVRRDVERAMFGLECLVM